MGNLTAIRELAASLIKSPDGHRSVIQQTLDRGWSWEGNHVRAWTLLRRELALSNRRVAITYHDGPVPRIHFDLVTETVH